MRRWLHTLTVSVSALLAGGCPTVELGEEPVAPGSCRPDEDYYREVIWPEYLAPDDPDRSCVGQAGCHRDSDGRSALRLVAAEPLSDADHRSNYEVVTSFLSCGAPDRSALLTKPEEGQNAHEGGELFAPGSEPYELFLDWFES